MEVRIQHHQVRRAMGSQLLDAMPQPLLVLNDKRQLVYCNQALLDIAGLTDMDALLGRRPGEIFGCAHADVEDGGCGTSEFCTQCGAVEAILSSLLGQMAVRECQMVRIKDGERESLDLKVWATPLEVAGRPFSAFTLTDVSHEKRRRVLERLFFHDLLNKAGGLRNLMDILADMAPASIASEMRLAKAHFGYMLDEIQAQRLLSEAEAHELATEPKPLSARRMLEATADMYREHDAAMGRIVSVIPPSPDVLFMSDQTLLSRILGNLVKNALEASNRGDAVLLSSPPSGNGKVIFEVRNSGVMPREVQLQVFKRSFSTKGLGRGLGTYSIRLFTERYLGGKVSFESAAGQGTVFRVTLPR